MRRKSGVWKATAVLITLVAVFLLTIRSTQAQELLYGNSVPIGTVVESDVFLSGSSVVIDGNVRGDVFAVGNTIVINGIVEGSLFSAGENVIINGSVRDSIYNASISQEFLAGSRVERSVYHVGARLRTDKESVIERDLRAISLGAELSGEVEREVLVIVGPGEIIRAVMDIVNRSSGLPELGQLPGLDIAAPVGPLPIRVLTSSAAPGATASGVLPGNAMVPAQQEEPVEAESSPGLAWLLQFVRELASFLIVGLLVSWLLPRQLSEWTSTARARPWRCMAQGLVVYAMGIFGLVILAVLVTAVGLGLGFLTLGDLAALTWAIGYSGLGFALTLFMLTVMYVSKIVVAVLVGWLILGRFVPRAADSRIWPLLLGLVIYVLLSTIPFLGWALGLVVSFMGLGAIWRAYSTRVERAEVEETAVPTPTK